MDLLYPSQLIHSYFKAKRLYVLTYKNSLNDISSPY
jgi:hypothetical protein